MLQTHQQYRIQTFIQKLQTKIQKMELQNKSSSSLDTISIKFTQSNIPSATGIKASQDHISLTYTVSLQNISQQLISLKNIQDQLNLSIQIDKQTIESRYNDRYQQSSIRYPCEQIGGKDVFKKKSILKISNIDFSPFLDNFKQQQSPEKTKVKKTFSRQSNTGMIVKAKNNSKQRLSQSRKFSRSKQALNSQSQENFGQKLLLDTFKFMSIKKDQILEPITLRKKSISLKRQIETRNPSFSTDRKTIKFPIIKGSNCHANAVTQRKKAFTSHENFDNDQKTIKNFSQKMLQGKPCRMSEDDQKAKKYLKKIIQSRNSIIHFSEKKPKRISKQFKENIEEYCY